MNTFHNCRPTHTQTNPHDNGGEHLTKKADYNVEILRFSIFVN